MLDVYCFDRINEERLGMNIFFSLLVILNRVLFFYRVVEDIVEIVVDNNRYRGFKKLLCFGL